MFKNVNLDLCLTHYRKVNSTWITDLIVKAKTIKLLEENIEENFCNLELGKGFLVMTPKA